MERVCGWGRAGASLSDVRVVAPATAAAAVIGAGPRGVLSRGRGRSYGDAAGRWLDELILVDGTGTTRRLGSADDAFWATVGGMGLTGRVVSATLRLLPVESSWPEVEHQRCASLDEVLDELDRSAQQEHWAVAASRTPGSDPLAYQPQTRLAAPWVPCSVVGAGTARGFNAAWWARAAAKLEQVVLPAGVTRRCLSWDAIEPPGPLLAQVRSGGDLDLVIAAAGILSKGSHGDPDLARDLLAVNLVGQVDVLVPLGEALREQRHGTIVVLSSVAGLRARKSNYLYGMSKAGLDSFACGLADRLHPDGVRVLLVRPGHVHGRMTKDLPVPPLVATPPEAVARSVRRALDRRWAVAWSSRVLQVLLPVLQLVPRAIWRRLEL